MKRYWLAITSAIIGGLLVIFPILGVLFGEDEDAPVAVLILSLIVIGGMMMAGLWWLRTGRFGETVSLTLVGVGLATFGLFFFWMLLIPTALALIVIWFGIIKGGLVAELRPAPDT